MIDILLYIEPTGRSKNPVIDSLTKRMASAFRKSTPGVFIDGEIVQAYSAGFHVCTCGAKSDNTEHILENQQFQVNSLCVHYLAWHRDSISQLELGKLTQLPNEEVEPTMTELGVTNGDFVPKSSIEYMTTFRQLAEIINSAIDNIQSQPQIQKSSLDRIAQNVETIACLRGDSGLYENTRPEGLVEFQKEMYLIEDYLRYRLLSLGYVYPTPRSISETV